jgi:hypothetical protein
VIPGYGGGCRRQGGVESDTRALAFEAGRKYGGPGHHFRRTVGVARGERIGIIERMVEYVAKRRPNESARAADVGNTAAFRAPRSPAGSRGLRSRRQGLSPMGMGFEPFAALVPCYVQAARSVAPAPARFRCADSRAGSLRGIMDNAAIRSVWR